MTMTMMTMIPNGTVPYEQIGREERRAVALLAGVLRQGDNIARLLDVVACPLPRETGQSPVFIEYAHLRDLWHARFTGHEQRSRQLIASFLPKHLNDRLGGLDIAGFNGVFIRKASKKTPSKKTIQSPGNWSVSRLADAMDDNDALLRACMFKWAFNAKPDLVVRLGPRALLCVEAKDQSPLSSYPSSASEKAIFKRRGMGLVGQIELQRFAMEQVLGVQGYFVLLCRKPPRASTADHVVTWSRLNDVLDWMSLTEAARVWLARMG